MSKTKTADNEPVVIKKYANRRLYNTESSSYVTLDDLAQMVRAERDFVVKDAKTGDDLTHSVLTQIIVEQESKDGQSLLPIPFLRQLIRFYGDSIERLVPSYLQMSLERLTQEQEKFRKQFTDAFGGAAFGSGPFGAAAFEAMQEHAKQNMLMFEKAMTMFSPFNKTTSSTFHSDEQEGANSVPHKTEGLSARHQASDQDQDIAELKKQLSDMQKKIDKLIK